MKKTLQICLILIFFFSVAAKGNYKYEQYTRYDEVNDVNVKSGAVYLATETGLKAFLTWNPSESLRVNASSLYAKTSKEISTNNFECVEIDGAGNVWIGCSGKGGIIKCELEMAAGLTLGANAEFYPSYNVRDIAIDSSGKAWYACEEGLYFNSGGSIVKYDYFSGKKLRTSAFDESGALWCGADNGTGGEFGLAKIDIGAGEIAYFNESNSEIASNIVKRVKIKDKKAYYLTGKGCGFYNIADESWTKFDLPKMQQPTDAVFYEDFVFISSLDSGIVRYDETTGDYAVFSKEYLGLETNKIKSLSLNDGTLWAGSLGGGALKITNIDSENPTVEIFDDSSIIPSNNINCLTASENGLLYIGTADKGVIMGDEGGWINDDFDEDDNFNITASTCVGQEEIWFGTDDFGLVRYDGKWSYIKDSRNGSITALLNAQDGALVIGTSEGLFKYDKNNEAFDFFDKNEQILNTRTINALAQDGDGGIWISVKKQNPDPEALYRYSELSLEQIDLEGASMSSKEIIALDYDESTNILWLGGLYDLCRVDLGKSPYQPVRVLSNTELIRRVGEDKPVIRALRIVGERVYLGLSSGLMIINKSTGVVEEEFSPKSGAPGYEVNGIAIMPDGAIWSSTQSAGLAKFTLAQFDPPILNEPSDKDSCQSFPVVFRWEAVEGATGYNFHISANSGFNTAYENNNIPANVTERIVDEGHEAVANMSLTSWNYWRVRASGGEWSETRRFKFGDCEKNFEVSPIQIDFGTISECESAERMVAIESKGDVAVSVTASATGTGFSVSPSISNIPAGESATFAVTFQSSQAGANSGEAIFFGGGLEKSVDLDGFVDTPNIDFIATLDFGSIKRNSTATKIITINNNGELARFVELNNDNLTVSPDSASIAPGDSMSFTVEFTPSATGAFESTIFVELTSPCNYPNFGEIFVKAQVFEDEKTVETNAPSAVDFGKVVADADSVAAFQIENAGNVALVLQDMNISGSVFAIESLTKGGAEFAAGDTLKPSEKIDVSVRFSPINAESYSGNFTASFDQSETVIVALSGEGIEETPTDTSASISISVEPPSAAPGEKVKISVWLEEVENIENGATISGKTKFDARVLAFETAPEVDDKPDFARESFDWIMPFSVVWESARVLAAEYEVVACFGEAAMSEVAVSDLKCCGGALKQNGEPAIFEVDLCREGDSLEVIRSETAIVGVFPNPASDGFSVKYRLDENLISGAKIAIMNMLGREVAVVEILSARGTTRFSTENINSGTYIIALKTPGATDTRKIYVYK